MMAHGFMVFTALVTATLGVVITLLVSQLLTDSKRKIEQKPTISHSERTIERNISVDCPEVGGLYLRRGKETERWGTGGWIKRTKASIEFATSAYFNASHDDLLSDNYGHQPITLDLLNKFISGTCPLRAIVYVFPHDYLTDLNVTNGELQKINHHVFFGPFVLQEIYQQRPFHRHDFPAVFTNSTFLCDSTACLGWCKKQPHMGCLFLRQCASLSRVSKGLEVPIQMKKKNAILYLKAHGGLTWNETVVLGIKNYIITRGYVIKTFVYSQYKREVFLESMFNSSFAVVFSPGEIAPGYVLELLEANVPIFALTKKALGLESVLQEGIGGEIADIGAIAGYPAIYGRAPTGFKRGTAEPGITLKDALMKLGYFIENIGSYKPLLDIGQHAYMPYECSAVLSKIIPTKLHLRSI